MLFSEYLCELVLDSGLNQKEFADAVGWDRSMFSQYLKGRENGGRFPPAEGMIRAAQWIEGEAGDKLVRLWIIEALGNQGRPFAKRVLAIGKDKSATSSAKRIQKVAGRLTSRDRKALESVAEAMCDRAEVRKLMKALADML